MADRKSLRLSATLLFVGLLLSIITSIPHPGRENPNNHTAAFAEYASNGNWTAIHLGEFAGIMIFIAGLIVLFFALNVSSGLPGWVARFAAVSAVVSLALYGVLQAVDGVALKQAVDAWVSAPSAEKAARFASAESIRWLEWGGQQLLGIYVGSLVCLVRDRDRVDGKDSQADWLPNGVVRPRLNRAGLGDRLRGLLGNW